MDILPLQSPFKEFLALSLDRCMQAVSAQSGSIFLFDEGKQELVLEIARNAKRLDLQGTRARLGERIVGKVALEKKPYLVEDIDKELSLRGTPRFTHYQSKSFLSLPLESSGEILGVMNLTDKTLGMSFDDEDLGKALLVCKYVGSALGSVRQYLEQQRALIEKLSKELGDLQKANERHKKFSSLGKFVGGLVHEINNPLDGVIRYINLSLDCVQEEDPVTREYLLQAKKGLDRIVGFIRSLLDFSWSFSPQGREIDINRALEESIFLFGHTYHSYNIKVTKTLAPTIPKLSDHGLKVVFNNLLKNACEAMRERGGDLGVSTFLEGSNVIISLSDTGKGIPSHLQEKIFEPFFTTKNMGEGSGLGLALAVEIVEKYGGKIEMHSQEQKGTTVRIALPVKTNTAEYIQVA